MTKTRQIPREACTKLAVRKFKDYLTENNIPHPEKVLRRSKQEKQIEILIERVPYNIFEVWADTINDPYFTEVNKVFVAKLTKVSNYKYPIQDKDINTLDEGDRQTIPKHLNTSIFGSNAVLLPSRSAESPSAQSVSQSVSY